MLLGTDARELVKFSFVCVCTVFLYTFDSSIAYHEIRTQSIIKIYIFFNLLEVSSLERIYLIVSIPIMREIDYFELSLVFPFLSNPFATINYLDSMSPIYIAR